MGLAVVGMDWLVCGNDASLVIDRDGWDISGSRKVRISNCNCQKRFETQVPHEIAYAKFYRMH